MTGLFVSSVAAGIITGAPFGAAGALVAETALYHDKVRLNSAILAAVSGNSILAFCVSFASNPIRNFFQQHEKAFFLVFGVGIIVLGLAMLRLASFEEPSARRTFGALSIFFITLLHPGSAAAFLGVTAIFSIKFLAFKEQNLVFTGGIAVGSFFVFSALGIVFWFLRGKAKVCVQNLRYVLVLVLGITGLYFVVTAL